ncbi:MAG: hypothetical protein BRC44_12970 [Cyanobacteria bacterium QS_4_48_99]|nr:MAG: hypothetical protein BRC44_12970 [Cyanobacteria bacterium QS_4_48_99]
MSVTISIKTIELAAGSHIRIHNLSWLDFEDILAELENERNTRASYYQQVLEVVSPLALHEPQSNYCRYCQSDFGDSGKLYEFLKYGFIKTIIFVFICYSKKSLYLIFW